MSTSFRLEKEEYEELEKIRWREHDDLGDVIRKACLEYIRLHQEGNDTFKLDTWNLNPMAQAIPNLFAEDSKFIEDYQSSNKEDRQRRFQQIQNILQLYKNINYESSK